ncbi:MAG: hypothetical protein IT497_04420 [Ottowia sp.]|nr:hypothetical protein [Ottowia sp.]
MVDSIPIEMCNNLRIKRHRGFKDIAQLGKCSTEIDPTILYTAKRAIFICLAMSVAP